MTRIIVSEDCGNSPKNNLLKHFSFALAKRDVKFILGCVTGTIGWKIVGSHSIEGRENLAEYLRQITTNEVALLTIHHIASHGKAGAVDGTQKLKNRNLLTFCDIYEFGNTNLNILDIGCGTGNYTDLQQKVTRTRGWQI